MNKEQVSCFYRKRLEDIGPFQGITLDVKPYLHLLPGINCNWFVDRGYAENNPGIKQIIPYIIVVRAGWIFRYRRGAKSGEERLRANWSIGVGGHINPGDASYNHAVRREIKEEIGIAVTDVPPPVAMINDDTTEVGRVHFGVVHVVRVACTGTMEKDVIENGEFMVPENLCDCDQRQTYESWSRFCLENIYYILTVGRSNDAQISDLGK